jgi:hypothetical protein
MIDSARTPEAPRWKVRLLKIVSILLIAGVTQLSIGCYGSFPLTRTLYKFNGNLTESKWVHSIVLWILGIFGVYAVTIFVDFVILNLVEFWSGDKLMTSAVYEQDDGTRIALSPGENDNEAILTIEKNGELLAMRRFQRQDNGIVLVFDELDEPAGKVIPASDGGFMLQNADGTEEHHLSGTKIEELRAAIEG